MEGDISKTTWTAPIGLNEIFWKMTQSQADKKLSIDLGGDEGGYRYNQNTLYIVIRDLNFINLHDQFMNNFICKLSTQKQKYHEKS